MKDLMALDATDQARLVRDGEVTATELVTAAIDAIETRDGDINAVTYRRFERALEEAAQIDPEAPFAGVPTLTKSLDDLACAPANYGSAWVARSGRTAKTDSPLVARLRRSGHIILGQSASPEFGLVSTTETTDHGITRNPWDRDRTSGGSSGGASAVVSAGMVAVGPGGDGGGSIRMPAAFCQLVGLKPSLGTIPRDGAGDRWGHSVPGVVTRTVRDTAALLDVLSDRGNRSRRLPALGYGALRAELDETPGRLRVGFVAHGPDHAPAVSDDIAAGVRSTADLLSSLGHDVSESFPTPLFDPDVLTHFFDSLSVTVCQSVDALAAEIGAPGPDDLDPVTSLWERRGRELTGLELATSLAWQGQYRARMNTWWEDYDLLLSPVFPTPAPPVSWPWEVEDGLQKTVDVLAFTAPFNTTGQPAISVPAGLTAQGLPVGVQLVAAYGREDLLLKVARQLEIARPWSAIAPAYRS